MKDYNTNVLLCVALAMLFPDINIVRFVIGTLCLMAFVDRSISRIEKRGAK